MNTNLGQKSGIANWLLIGVVMTVVQIALGGITRLTGSGLSITEWDIVTGALPPFSDQDWLVLFNKYRHTPQYHLINFNFTLWDFKCIFFWEWFHRLWARLIGVVFLVGFVYFLIKKQFDKAIIPPLLLLFLLGGLQGTVGWIMVASGLVGDAVYVKPTKLALHFVFALGLLAYLFWFYLEMVIKKQQKTYSLPLRGWSWAIFVVLMSQLGFGALMAGHKAANVAPTWPDINGSLLPDKLLRYKPLWINLIENPIMIHFVHRGLAYALLVMLGCWTFTMLKVHGSLLFRQTKYLPVCIALVQVLLGIFTVLSSTGIIAGQWNGFDWLALSHQLTGVLLLLSMVWVLFLVRGRERIR